jgi:hypothetical protein
MIPKDSNKQHEPPPSNKVAVDSTNSSIFDAKKKSSKTGELPEEKRPAEKRPYIFST